MTDENQGDEQFDEAGNYIEREEEDGGDGGVVHRFLVKIEKETGSLVFECSAGSDVEIRNVSILPKGVEYETDAANELYSGPNFADLDEGVREGFYKYLEDRKIDADFSFFVQSYAHNKEQREYVHWLQSVGDFVGGKPLLK